MMDRKKEQLIKQEMWLTQPYNLCQALASFTYPLELLTALLIVMGFTKVDSMEAENVIRVYTYNEIGEPTLQLLYERPDFLHGRLNASVTRLFNIVLGIETELTGALFLPPELRQIKMYEICQNNQIEQEDLWVILHRWSNITVSHKAVQKHYKI